MFNPFKPNGISHSSQLDQSISVLKVVVCYFYSSFNGTFSAQMVETLIRWCILRYAASDLGLHCFPMFHKKDPWLIWIKE